MNWEQLYKEFSKEHLDGSQLAIVSLGERITDPPQATLSGFEDALRDWDSNKERYERIAKTTVNELAFICLQKMILEEAKPRVELGKVEPR